MNRPNILLVMADQMAASALPVYGNRVVKAPHLARLAERSAVFDNAYCNFPICAPSRYSMLTGRLPWSIHAWDNAAELAAATPTVNHYLKTLGYATTLCGKMHFVGPDQLHGYDERLITDIYPADFAWVPDWTQGPRDAPSGVSLRGVVEAGECVRSLQIDYDDETEHLAAQKIYDLARVPDAPPFFLTISFSHPHSPFTAPAEHWGRYRHADIDMPRVGPIPYEALDTHSRWLYQQHGRDRFEVTEEHVRNARHAYYGMISYVDDKVGRLLQVLEETGLAGDTVVVFASDHGEMLGERGMWYKQTFFEDSARVPLMVSGPGVEAGRHAGVTSLVDLFPTLLDLASGGKPPALAGPVHGESWMPLLAGGGTRGSDAAICEYSDMGVCAPCRMIRVGSLKSIYTHGHPAQLFDLAADPRELRNVSGDPAYADREAALRQRLLADWDPEAINALVLRSQAERRLIYETAGKSGARDNWSYVVRPDDKRRFVRGGGDAEGTAAVKGRARFPYVAPAKAKA